MKIYNKVVINMETNEVVSEDSFDHYGTIALMKGGGGGGSGQVSYPAYMETWHSTWMDNVASAMTTAQATSPWDSETAYDPTALLTTIWTQICAFNTLVDAMDAEADWASGITAAETAIDAVIDATYITNAADAFEDIIDDHVESDVLPRFKTGLRDINAVMSSSFVIGQSIIEGMADRDVAKYTEELSYKFHLQRNEMILQGAAKIMEVYLQRIQFERDVTHYTTEYGRIGIVAETEEIKFQLEIDSNDALWDLETFQYGANMLAAIGGGTAPPKSKQPSLAQSALGGAISGAATGAAVAGIPGAVAGGLLGLGSAFL